MALTVGLITLAGVVGLGLSLGAAVLLGAVLAPTDPVLASDVTVENPSDQDDVRFSLTGEAGLNDGTAFPFVMLGLGLLHLHELGPGGLRWLGIDLLWAAAGGLLVGGVFGTLVGRFVLYLRRTHKEAVGLDNFLALGLIALAYGVALLLHAYGFLAVFAAGLALRRVERQTSGDDAPPELPVEAVSEDQEEEIATHPEKASAYMAQAVLSFNTQLERIGEVVVVLLAGGMLLVYGFPRELLWFAPLLFLGIRPVAVLVGLLRGRTSATQRGLIAWFGIRGIGSVYYLMYAIEHGLQPDLARELTALTLSLVAVSVVVHGISVTPLMHWYTERRGSEQD
jgi:NhaP-type Na+/H+ or K+/H+ antiporter